MCVCVCVCVCKRDIHVKKNKKTCSSQRKYQACLNLIETKKTPFPSITNAMNGLCRNKKCTHRATNPFDASITTHRKPSQGFHRSVVTPLNIYKDRVGWSARNFCQLCVTHNISAVSQCMYTFYTSNESWILGLFNEVCSILFRDNML